MEHLEASLKLLAAIVLGVLASFGLTILGEQIIFGLMTKDAHLPFAELGIANPVIALIVGAVVGLITKEKARVAAIFSLAPWTAWLVLATNSSHSPISHWVITIVIASIYLALGIGVAAFVGGRMARSVAKGTTSHV